jgi:hypothetical protein
MGMEINICTGAPPSKWYLHYTTKHVINISQIYKTLLWRGTYEINQNHILSYCGGDMKFIEIKNCCFKAAGINV